MSKWREHVIYQAGYGLAICPQDHSPRLTTLAAPAFRRLHRDDMQDDICRQLVFTQFEESIICPAPRWVAG